MHSAAPESCCCRNLYCTVCWRTKRRRVLAYRGSWKRLRLLTLMLIMVFGCMYLHMSSSSVKVSMFAALNLLADHEIDVRDGTRLIYMADSTSWFNARDAMQLMKDSKCPSENCRFTCKYSHVHSVTVEFRFKSLCLFSLQLTDEHYRSQTPWSSAVVSTSNWQTVTSDRRSRVGFS